MPIIFVITVAKDKIQANLNNRPGIVSVLKVLASLWPYVPVTPHQVSSPPAPGVIPQRTSKQTRCQATQLLPDKGS